MEMLLELKASFIPLVFVGGGLLFILAAIIGKLDILFNLSLRRQAIASTLGVILILSGIAPYFLAPRSPVVNAAVLSPQNETTSAEFFAAPMTTTAPDTFIVASHIGWQTTAIEVQAGTQVSIEALEGEWTPWGGTTLYSAVGDVSYICLERDPDARCNEPIGDAPIGMLIGRIGDQWFQIGAEAVITAETSGQLHLRINDADGGLFDNEGSITIRVTVAP